MDILKNQDRRAYSYISRYSNFPFYYNTEDQKYMYGLTSQLDTSTPYTVVNVEKYTTLDYLANKYYGRPDYFWIIADFNRIQDPFIELYPRYTTLKIPGLGNIEYLE